VLKRHGAPHRRGRRGRASPFVRIGR
jgi:hypothetical protein